MCHVKSVAGSFLSFLLVFVLFVPFSLGQEEDRAEVLKLPKPLLDDVETVVRDDLEGVNAGVVSADGKFLYTSSWRHNSINAFRRDQQTGELSHVQSLTSKRDLAGSTSIRLSPDGKYAVAPAFQTRTIVLLHVDQESGKLRIADVAKEGENGVIGLTFAIAAEFSPDSKFVYASDPTAPGLRPGDTGAMTVFRVTKSGKLRMVESNRGEGGCFAGVRWATVHPKLNLVYSTCNAAHSLVVSKRDPDTGKLSVSQILRDETNGIAGLQGAMTSALSPDGKFLYVSSGRFSGDTAIGVYEIRKEGLRFVHELHEQRMELKNFLGGNGIVVSPDGKCVFAAGTRSQSFVCLQRDPESGRVTYLETVNDDGKQREGVDDLFGVGVSNTAGAAGIAISPDSKFVYVMVEDAGKIRVFVRNDLKEPRASEVTATDERATD